MSKIERNSGFTLLEVMIVAALVAIGAGVAFFSIGGMMPNLRLSAATRDLKSNLNLAKLMAIRENEPISVLFFNPDAKSYTIYFDKDGDGAPSAGDTIVKRISMPNNVNLAAAAFGVGGNPVIAFSPSGLAFGSDGTVLLTNTKGGQRNINLAPTGRVDIEIP